ncbi:MAG TPA: hypothetical protein VGU26_00575 [Gaiellaceae bacterium]|nr:hypothetical protein [Gaiellaceae bacterium]
MSDDRKLNESHDSHGHADEGDDVEAHAYRSAESNESHDAYRKADKADAYGTEEPPDVEGHAFNVESHDSHD